MSLQEKYDFIFDGIEISKDWQFSIDQGISKFFDSNLAVVNYLIREDYLVVNAISKNNKPWSIAMIKCLMALEKKHKKAMITTELPGIRDYMNKKGFVYHTPTNTHIRR